MAPTICLIDYPIVGSDASSSSTRTRHRPCQDGFISKRQRLTLKKHFPKIAEGIHTPVSSLPTSPSICEADTPSHPMLQEANLPDDPVAPRTLSLNRRKELMDIVIRTLALVRRNYILQVRLDSLRLEANNFFHSMLNNEEKKECQKNHDKTTCDDSSNLVVLSTNKNKDKIKEQSINDFDTPGKNLSHKSPLTNRVSSTSISSTNDHINNLNSCSQ
ncbi:hypothetical protein PV327_002181 [Microctonus hyperodae]|uniref:Uncharacterized protein n=1 Tax=Microctonus hyperodae TaxID=165561 RepID=A0AA39FF73_MICHY|nr:hypothetical protein PV327_002181 [Microctonus hyperodae]